MREPLFAQRTNFIVHPKQDFFTKTHSGFGSVEGKVFKTRELLEHKVSRLCGVHVERKLLRVVWGDRDICCVHGISLYVYLRRGENNSWSRGFGRIVLILAFIGCRGIRGAGAARGLHVGVGHGCDFITEISLTHERLGTILISLNRK